MSRAKIYLVGDSEKQLTSMDETPFEKEDILQVLIERYPDLLPGDQIDPENPRRWLFVSRELGVPGKGMGSAIWSLDHLFLDQDGIPTFVECKRASDTRSRREVVAQMLDYAANGTRYWEIEKLRQAASENAVKRGLQLDAEVYRLISKEGPGDIELYWDTVENNLRAGRVRLIFVSDHTSSELRRLVEFLNEKMNDVEVLAVEIKQFIGLDQKKAIVPRVIGLTETTRKTWRKPTTREKFLAQCELEVAEFVDWMLAKAEKSGYFIQWNVVGFSFRAVLPDETRATFIQVYPPNKLDLYFKELSEKYNLQTDEVASLKKELGEFQIFKKGGEHTFHAYMTLKTIPVLREKVIDYIFDRVGRMGESQSG